MISKKLRQYWNFAVLAIKKGHIGGTLINWRGG